MKIRFALSICLLILFAAGSAFAQTNRKGYTPRKPVPKKESLSSGTSLLDGESGDADFSCRAVKPGTKLKMNFEKEEIAVVIEWISQYGCKNFIISDKVKGGKITIMSPKEVTVREAFRAFEVALAANGLAMVPSGKFLEIVEAKDNGAAFDIRNGGSLPGGDNIVTQLFPIKHGDVSAMVTVMEKFKSSAGDITTYPATNLMIVTDHASAIRRMGKILSNIDIIGLGEQIFIIEVQNSTAEDMKSLLEGVFDKPNNSSQSASKSTSSRTTTRSARAKELAAQKETSSIGDNVGADVKVSKIMADERTNNLIIVSSKASYEQVLYLVEKLDVPVEGSDGIYVMPLQNADATELSQVISSFSRGGGGSSGRTSANQARRPGQNRTTPTAPPQQGKSGSAGQLFTGEIIIQADEATNSLVVQASKSDYQVLERVVSMLDLPRRQVFIEAMIFEVSLVKNRSLGFAFHGGIPLGGDAPNGILFGGSQDAALGSLIPTLLPQLTLGAIAGEPINIGGINLPPVGVILNALASDSEANVLSNPTLLVMDNEQATISIGENIPVPVSTGLGNLLGGAGGVDTGNLGDLGALAGLAGGFGGITPQIQRQNVGVTLDVTPQINDGDFVNLQISQEITAVQSIDATGPTLSNRSAQTSVTVKDQQTVVIGGLMEDRVTTTIRKVPILGDIPLLGHLFRNQSKIKTKTNLIIVITPHIIKDQSDYRRILEKKMEERRQFIEQFTSGRDEKLAIDLDYRRKRGGLEEIRFAMAEAEREEAEKAALQPADLIIISPHSKDALPEDLNAAPPTDPKKEDFIEEDPINLDEPDIIVPNEEGGLSTAPPTDPKKEDFIEENPTNLDEPDIAVPNKEIQGNLLEENQDQGEIITPDTHTETVLAASEEIKENLSQSGTATPDTHTETAPVIVEEEIQEITITDIEKALVAAQSTSTQITPTNK